MKSIRKLFTLTILALLIAGYIFSAMFILAHSNHEHDSNGDEGACNACVHVLVAEKMLKRLFAAAVSALFALTCFYISRFVWKSAGFHLQSYTPICMKVRINN